MKRIIATLAVLIALGSLVPKPVLASTSSDANLTAALILATGIANVRAGQPAYPTYYSSYPSLYWPSSCGCGRSNYLYNNYQNLNYGLGNLWQPITYGYTPYQYNSYQPNQYAFGHYNYGIAPYYTSPYVVYPSTGLDLTSYAFGSLLSSIWAPQNSGYSSNPVNQTVHNTIYPSNSNSTIDYGIFSPDNSQSATSYGSFSPAYSDVSSASSVDYGTFVPPYSTDSSASGMDYGIFAPNYSNGASGIDYGSFTPATGSAVDYGTFTR